MNADIETEDSLMYTSFTKVLQNQKQPTKNTEECHRENGTNQVYTWVTEGFV